MRSDNKELIAEARGYGDAIFGGEGENWMRLVCLTENLADALEQVTAERDALAAVIENAKRVSNEGNMLTPPWVKKALAEDPIDRLAGVIADAKADALEDLALMWERGLDDNAYAADEADWLEAKSYCGAVRAYSKNRYPHAVTPKEDDR